MTRLEELQAERLRSEGAYYAEALALAEERGLSGDDARNWASDYVWDHEVNWDQLMHDLARMEEEAGDD